MSLFARPRATMSATSHSRGLNGLDHSSEMLPRDPSIRANSRTNEVERADATIEQKSSSRAEVIRLRARVRTHPPSSQRDQKEGLRKAPADGTCAADHYVRWLRLARDWGSWAKITALDRRAQRSR